jgi:hypothetical protein
MTPVVRVTIVAVVVAAAAVAVVVVVVVVVVVAGAVAPAVTFTFVLSSGSFLRYSKSDFGGIHVQRTSPILCGSFKNMRLFIQ